MGHKSNHRQLSILPPCFTSGLTAINSLLRNLGGHCPVDRPLHSHPLIPAQVVDNKSEADSATDQSAIEPVEVKREDKEAQQHVV